MGAGRFVVVMIGYAAHELEADSAIRKEFKYFRRMTRASLGHTGHALSAGPVTKAAYFLVTIASVLRILSPLAGEWAELALWLAGGSWTGAFGLFTVFYGRILMRPRVRGEASAPI